MLLTVRAPMAFAFAAAVISLCGCTNTATLYQATDWVGDGQFTDGIEGPAVDRDGNLYAVNFQRQGTIGIVRGKDDAELFVTLPDGSVGNGIRFAPKGTVEAETFYIADYTGHNVLSVDVATREVRVHAHNPQMNQPNDIAITNTGVIYASDPNWQNLTGNLWRIDTSGAVVLLEENMGTTNGVEISPDDRHLYVNESVQKKVYVYDIQQDGNLANKRLLIEFDEHGLDGMRCDNQGNLYIARYGAGSVAIVSPEGKLLREVALKGKFPTNVAFGGKDGSQVFVTMQKRGAIETFFAEHPGRAFFQ